MCFRLVSLCTKVIGFHFVGPNAGEITQGFGLAVRLGAKKSDFNKLVSMYSLPHASFSVVTLVCALGIAAADTDCIRTPLPLLFYHDVREA